MCARYSMIGGEVDGVPLPADCPPLYNIAPTHVIPVIQCTPQGLDARYMAWGMKPVWADYQIINARLETVLDKHFFRGCLASRRVILPASGFFEWAGEVGSKQAMYFHAPRYQLFGFPGFYHTNEETGAQEVALLTMAPNELLAKVHDRMPCMLPPAMFLDYLNARSAFEASMVCGMQFPADAMDAYTVTRAVGNPRYQSPDCVVPMEVRHLFRDEPTEG